MSFAGNSPTDADAQLAALRTEYGEFPVREHTVEVTRELLAETMDVENRRALGGARVVLQHDGEILLVRDDEDAAWDAPGGDRDSGESHVATARRWAHEHTGIECAITDVELVHRYEFTLVEGSTGATGIWVLFDGETAAPSLDLADDVAEAGWFQSPPTGIAEDVADCFEPDAPGTR